MTTRCSIRPSLETLETRDTPAGTVTATFAGRPADPDRGRGRNTLLIARG